MCGVRAKGKAYRNREELARTAREGRNRRMKIRTLLLAGLVLCVPLWATTTTVTQTLVGPDGLPASGTVYIRITAACSYAGSYIGTKTLALKFGPSGSPAVTTFSTALVPNVAPDGTLNGSGGCAGTSYTVSWAFTGGAQQPVETWVVPVSGVPLSIDAVKTGPVTAPTTPLNPSQLSTAGGTVGQAMCVTSSGWAPGNCGGGGTAVVWRGAWSSGTTYAAYNVVSSGGSSYLAIAASLNIPVSNTAYWGLLAQAGATGAAGPAPAGTGIVKSTGGVAGLATPGVDYSTMRSYTAAVNSTSYQDGKITFTKGSNVVSGTGTAWTTAMTGDWVATVVCLQGYQFTQTSATSGLLDRNYQCPSVTVRYALMPSTYVTAATHGLSSIANVQCFSSGTTQQVIQPGKVLIYANKDVEVIWRAACAGGIGYPDCTQTTQTGSCTFTGLP
jgi:hypothetical protein